MIFGWLKRRRDKKRLKAERERQTQEAIEQLRQDRAQAAALYANERRRLLYPPSGTPDAMAHMISQPRQPGKATARKAYQNERRLDDPPAPPSPTPDTSSLFDSSSFGSSDSSSSSPSCDPPSSGGDFSGGGGDFSGGGASGDW